MLVPYNAAAKSSPPKVPRRKANYFQPKDIERIWDALEKEPIKMACSYAFTLDNRMPERGGNRPQMGQDQFFR